MSTFALILILFVCLAAAAFAADYAVTSTLIDIALDHDPPKILARLRGRISGSGNRSGFLRARELAEDELLRKNTVTVRIKAGDGTELTGHWLPAENTERVIIAMHGWRSRWARDFGMIADFWAGEGCSVLFAEQRGQNASTDPHMGFGLTERNDCVSWARWAAAEGLPVYLAGVSMGAATVLMAADLPLPGCVRGIMADCAFTSPDAIWHHVVHDNLHLPFGLRSAVADRLCRRKTGFGSAEFSTVKSLRATSLPVLLIHGADDRFVPVSMTRENYEACAAPKRLLIVPGADHGMSYYRNREGYEAAVKAFWRDFDEC